MKAHELLPCAHCGHEARRVPRFCMGYAGDGVECPNCHAATPSWMTEDTAVKWWNRRAEPAPVKEPLTAEQPEHGPAAWLVDYGDGSDPEAYVGERPPGVAVECSMTPLYPESVKAERDALRAESAELRERVKELEADAARYRWLRGECESPNGGLTIASVTEWGLEGWSGDDPDNRIDAAMQEGKS